MLLVAATALYDQHVHSRHSFDCDTAPEEAVEAALSAELAGLSFTEHFDTHPDEWERCGYDYSAQADEIARLRDRFGQRLLIGHGIEVCYQPDNMDFILDFLSSHEFDVVLLSVHWADGRQLGWPDHWEGLDAQTGTRLYLEQVLRAARHCRDLRERHGRRCFDVLGHLDFVKRYTQRLFGEVHVDQYGQLLDEILRTCLEADLTPEANTSTVRRDLSEPMPGPDTIRRYVALGGQALTLGSDAHRPDSVGADLGRTARTLREVGVAYQAVFAARQRRQLQLD
jgi:histidinol-phosphatase (PHP family)